MTGRRSLVWALCTLAACTTPAYSAPIAIDSIRKLRDIVEASPSPDGELAAVTITSSSSEGGQDHVWIATESAPPRQLIRLPIADGAERNPVWSPDGKRVFIHVLRKGKDRVRSVEVANGDASDLVIRRDAKGRAIAQWVGPDADIGPEIRLTSFAPSPLGDRIAIIGTLLPSHADARRPGDDAYVAEHIPAAKQSLFVVSLITMKVSETRLPAPFVSQDWRQDGSEIAVITGGDDEKAGYQARAWRVDLRAGTITGLPGVVETVRSMKWGRDGLAYLARCEEEAPPECLELYAYDLATGRSRGLTKGLAGSLIDDLVVDRNGRSVVTPVMVGMRQRLAHIRLDNGELRWLDLLPKVVSKVRASPNGGSWAVVASGPLTAKSVLLLDPKTDAAKIMRLPKLRPDDWRIAASEPVSWMNQDLRIDGLLFRPAPIGDASAPVVMWVHGGPYGAFQERSYPLIDLLVSNGWAVLVANPRGSMGYGANFASKVRNDEGGADFVDLMSGLDTVLRIRGLDSSRTALIGYSYGGEIAAFAEGKTSRFKALVAGAPVIDQISQYGIEDTAFDDRWYVGQPWQRWTMAWTQSPLSLAGKASTPMMLFQGDDDPVVPPTQAEEMYRALKEVGVPTTLVRYPRETHASLATTFGLSPTREPWHGVDLARRIMGFLHEALDGGTGRAHRSSFTRN